MVKFFLNLGVGENFPTRTENPEALKSIDSSNDTLKNQTGGEGHVVTKSNDKRQALSPTSPAGAGAFTEAPKPLGLPQALQAALSWAPQGTVAPALGQSR